MINLQDEEVEKAFLVYFEGEDSEHELYEMKELISSALLNFCGANCVKMREINPATYIGEGKVEEISEQVHQLNVDVVVFDLSLTGSQLRNLTSALGVKVIDRTMLILDIFARRAKSSEGKLQVSLAQLEYSKSRLSAISGSVGRFGSGGVGSRGPGETKLELDKRKVETEILKKRKELKEIQKNRNVTKNQRRKNNENIVALVGYSNAGKTTLLNTITKAESYADDKLFATLDVLTKRVWDNGVQYILSDTVGFISNLPHELMNAFSSTLEELRDANVVLIVLDASDKHKYEQLNVVEDEMKKQGVDKSKCILVYNKVDKINKFEQSLLKTFDYETCYIEAKNNKNILELKSLIRNRLA